jgi:hypothetical protein
MASGHVNRTNRPNTWLHRPATQREDFLANSEPSTHGTCVMSTRSAVMSAFGAKSENNCSLRDLPVLTRSCHPLVNFAAVHNADFEPVDVVAFAPLTQENT